MVCPTRGRGAREVHGSRGDLPCRCFLRGGSKRAGRLSKTGPLSASKVRSPVRVRALLWLIGGAPGPPAGEANFKVRC